MTSFQQENQIHDFLKLRKVNALILDTLSGAAATQALRLLDTVRVAHPEIPVVVLASGLAPDMKIAYRRHGAFAFVDRGRSAGRHLLRTLDVCRQLATWWEWSLALQ